MTVVAEETTTGRGGGRLWSSGTSDGGVAIWVIRRGWGREARAGGGAWVAEAGGRGRGEDDAGEVACFSNSQPVTR
jgi:hypothetical protein